jgi:hypothetical protein
MDFYCADVTVYYHENPYSCWLFCFCGCFNLFDIKSALLKSTYKSKSKYFLKNEGMVYKRLNKKNVLVVESDNRFYPAYEVKASDILEIREYECNIGRSDRKPESSETASVKEMFLELKRDINDLKSK